jgi:tryptophanyl-tRNA synthetase
MGITSQFRLHAKRYVTIFSGVQPSGELHLGNYFGVCQFLLNHQEKPFINERRIERQLFSIVDWHSMTVPDRKGLYQKTLHTAALLLAAGFHPSKTVIFRQSDVLEHAALMWILLCRVPANRLAHMIQWKVAFCEHIGDL